jgi:hypothetical protein
MEKTNEFTGCVPQDDDVCYLLLFSTTHCFGETRLGVRFGIKYGASIQINLLCNFRNYLVVHSGYQSLTSADYGKIPVGQEYK